jgi:LuxR family maltose regulon positive regulatory protein
MSPAGLDTLEEGDRTDPSPAVERDPLLKTKLFIPPVQPNRVPRPRLFEQMDQGLDKALILIAAPAGYGKTTLVSGWLRESKIPSAWLSLDEDDNDPIRFLQYFITALQKIFPAFQLGLLEALQGMRPSPYPALLNILINEVTGRDTLFVLVLDDFHVIHAQSVLEMITYLLEHLPPQMHMILLTRTDPPLPLSRLRVRNQLIEIRASQLRFTRTEIAAFLNNAMTLKLSPDDIVALEARTEGWIAGLQLAAISMTGGKDVHDFVSAFTGSHYYVMDYLAEEVLGFQPETIRSFLLQSSILDRMCGPLCDEVIEVEQPGATNGQAMLATLEQMNLFIVPLDSERRWYRYHHLFSDVLSRRLEQTYPDLIPNLHCRASRWYERNGFIFEAIRHALEAGDPARAAQLLDQNGCLLLMRGEVINLLHWIEAVEPYSQTLPWIAIQKAWALCLSGQMDRAEGPLQTAAQLVSSLPVTDDVRTMLGAITAARAFRANMQGETRLAAEFARQALDELPVSSDLSCSLCSAATSILGDASWTEGNLAQAQRAYADAVSISQAAGNIHMVIMTSSNLAEVLLEQGQLQKATGIFSGALQAAALPGGQISPLVDSIYAGLSKICYECNRLDDAAKYAQQCIESSQRWGSFESLAIGYTMLASVEQAQCSSDKARTAIRAAEQLIHEVPLSPWRSAWLKAALARLWISQGDLERAAILLEKSGIPVDGLLQDGKITRQQEPLVLVLLRLHLARCDYDAALTLSKWLVEKFAKTNRVGRVIEVLVLQALAFQGKKDVDQALAVLRKAFSLAQPEGYIRTFLDEGEPMAKLLFQAKSHLAGTGFAAELLSAFGSGSGTDIPLASHLIEPLTLRELEVLKLIEAGNSNQEIAARLVISLPTVKRHISNIYTKLGASSRTQAIARGKELNLFD